MRHPEFSGVFNIPDSGNVELPGVGLLHLAGMDLDAVSTAVRGRLAKRLRYPEVSVTLKNARPAGISVLGSVRIPGPHPYRPGWRISDALGASGGVAEGVRTADVTVTVIRAGTEKRETVKLDDVLSGAEGKDSELGAGDIVSVFAPDTITVYVSGEVKAQGIYHFATGSGTVAQAVVAAGGPTENASLSSVRLARVNGERIDVDITPTVLRGDASNSPPLEAGDMVIVPESHQRVAVFGSVTSPGIFTMPAGHPLTLAESLTLAKGPVRNSRLGRVAVSHPTADGKETHKIFDLARFFQKGDLSQNPVLIPGDVVWVPQSPDSTSWIQVLTGLAEGAVLYSVLRN